MTTSPKRNVRRWMISLLVLILLGFGGWEFAGDIIAMREQAALSSCSLGQLQLAFFNDCDVHGELPPTTVYDAAGNPLYSWRVLLLPYLDSQ